jgi:hypothetical protein
MNNIRASYAPERMIQVRNLDPQVKREMRLECAYRDLTLGELINEIWREHIDANGSLWAREDVAAAS